MKNVQSVKWSHEVKERTHTWPAGPVGQKAIYLSLSWLLFAHRRNHFSLLRLMHSIIPYIFLLLLHVFGHSEFICGGVCFSWIKPNEKIKSPFHRLLKKILCFVRGIMAFVCDECKAIFGRTVVATIVLAQSRSNKELLFVRGCSLASALFALKWNTNHSIHHTHKHTKRPTHTHAHERSKSSPCSLVVIVLH